MIIAAKFYLEPQFRVFENHPSQFNIGDGWVYLYSFIYVLEIELEENDNW